MELTNDFTVGVPVDQAWAVLTDVERIAPCMPGAQLQEVEGDEYRGVVKVKVGPITAQYKGAATFIERDDAAHRAVLRAEGRDTRGQGNASALITATLTSSGGGTNVRVVTDLTVTGKVAQFGRGVLVDVSGKLITQFVECLERDVLAADSGGGAESRAETGGAPSAAAPPSAAVANPSSGPSAADAPASPTGGSATASSEPSGTGNGSTPGGPSVAASSGPRKIQHAEAKAVDLLETAGAPVAKRVAPVVGLLIVILWLLRRRRR